MLSFTKIKEEKPNVQIEQNSLRDLQLLVWDFILPSDHSRISVGEWEGLKPYRTLQTFIPTTLAINEVIELADAI